MSKKHIWALVIIGLCAVIFILTRGTVGVNLIYDTVSMKTSIALLAFTAVGVVIGLLFR